MDLRELNIEHDEKAMEQEKLIIRDKFCSACSLNFHVPASHVGMKSHSHLWQLSIVGCQNVSMRSPIRIVLLNCTTSMSDSYNT